MLWRGGGDGVGYLGLELGLGMKLWSWGRIGLVVWSREGRLVADGELNDELVGWKVAHFYYTSLGEMVFVVIADESLGFESIHSRVRNQDV